MTKINILEEFMKIGKCAAIILSASLLFGCATTLAPRNIEDNGDGTVLVMPGEMLQKIVENWGFENGFKYVAYRETSSPIGQGGYNRVLVMGIDDPKDVPENFNLAIVPNAPHQALTSGGMMAVAFMGAFGGTGLLLLIILGAVL
jgi:hypothetical protein